MYRESLTMTPDRLLGSACVFSLVSLLTGIVTAEDQVAPVPLPTTEQVTVTASRYREKTARVPANVSVITEEDIAASTAADIPSLLRTLANVQVIDITGNRRHYSVDLRGFGETASSNTLVLVDGRRVNLPSVDWIHIPLERVRRIEITRGGRGSVLYGDNAGAGVINIITREEGPTRLEPGDVGRELREPASQRSGQRHPGRRFVRRRGKLLSVRTTTGTTATLQGGDVGGRLGFTLGDRGRLDVSGGFHTDNVGLPGAIRESQFQAGSRTDGYLESGRLLRHRRLLCPVPAHDQHSEPEFPELWISRPEGGIHHSSADFPPGPSMGMTQNDVLAVSPRLVVQESIGGLSNNLSIGYDWIQSSEDIANTSEFGGFASTNTFQLEKENQGFYIHDEIFPLESLALSAGFRHDRAIYRFAPSTPDRTSYDQNIFTTGINYELGAETFAYASYAGSFRYPVLNEIFNFFTNTIDSGITPQTASGVEAGLRHYFGGAFFGELNFFQIDLDREIFYNPAGGDFGFGANENFEGRTRRRGMEFSSGVSRGIATLRGNYSVVQTGVLDGQYAGRQVPGVPAHKMAAEIFLQISPGLTASVNATYVGERYFHSDWSNRFGKHDGYFLLNSRISYRWNRFTLFADFNNIMNHEYAEYGVLGGFPVERAFYPSPKFNARVGIRLPIL